MKFWLAAVLLLIAGLDSVSSYSLAFTPQKFGSTFVPQSRKRQLPPLAGFATSSQTASSISAATKAQKQQPKQRFTTTTTMLVETSGGIIELQELTEQSEGAGNLLSKQVRKSPSFWKIAGYASIPLSAALGFGLVPSRRLAAHAVGGVVSGLAGAVGKSRLDALTEDSAKPALAQAILDNGLDDDTIKTTQAAVEKVRQDYGLLDEDFGSLCTEIYEAYLLGMVKYNPKCKTTELKELEQLKTVLGLNNMQVGEAHAATAEEWYRTTCLFTPEEELDDPDHPDRQAMDKLLFLTERALRQGGETNEAFQFEMTRVAKAVGLLTLNQAMERVATVKEPFYKRALASTRAKLAASGDANNKSVSPAMLERARTRLGIDNETAVDMHVACFNQEVRDLLGLPTLDESEEEEEQVDLKTLKFADGSMERLEQLKETLGLPDTDADYEIATEATPLYQATSYTDLLKVLDKTMTPDQAWENMKARREELLLKEKYTKDLIASMVMQALGKPLEKCNKFAKVNNEAAAYDNLLEALEAKEALIAILSKSGLDELDFDETFCNPWDKNSANGFLTSEERIKLYKMFLNRSLKKSQDGQLSDATYNQIIEVKGLLGITDQQAEIEARAAFGPELQKVMKRATEEIVEDYTPELATNMQKQIDEVVQNYRLSETFVREVGATFYDKAVALVSEESPGGIPTQKLFNALEALRELFKLMTADTYPVHMEYFGSVYKKAVLEAMGSTGVIRPEFRDSLSTLRDRLGVSEEDCEKIYLEAVEDKMKPMVEWIGSEMERTMLSQQQLSQRRGKDMGEDVFQTGKGADGVLGLGAEVNIMSDIMNLVDFYLENDVVEEQEVKVPATEEGGKEETVVETVYPVTALGVDAIDQEMAELLYRQFVVGAFQAQGEKAARYEGARATFGGILGLDKDKIEEINSNIGSTVYDNFVGNAMKTKGAMDQQDMMFLANIQGKLGISAEEGEKMLVQAQKKVLSEEINVLMDDATPETIKAFREKCNAMGMDLFEDVGISKPRLTRMFEAEVTPGLKDGTITAENSEFLIEIQESLGVEPEECETMFENLLLRLSKNAMNVISGELLRGREENTVDAIKELVRYAAFTDGELGLEVNEADGYKVYNLYDSFDFSGEDPSQVETNKELLRVAMGIE